MSFSFWGKSNYWGLNTLPLSKNIKRDSEGEPRSPGTLWQELTAKLSPPCFLQGVSSLGRDSRLMVGGEWAQDGNNPNSAHPNENRIFYRGKKKSIDFSQPYANELLKVLQQSPGSWRNYDTNLGLSRVSTFLLGSFFSAFRPSLDAQWYSIDLRMYLFSSVQKEYWMWVAGSL